MSMAQEYDLFNNPMIQAAASALSSEEKARYKAIGEQLYGSVDFVNSTITDETQLPYSEAAAYICDQLRSGMHPSILDDNEKQVMAATFGSTWYTRWGYVERDLTEIFTIKFSEE